MVENDVSVKTLDRMQVSYFRTAIDGYRVEQRQDGGGTIFSIPIFREGVFKDSMGEQHNWEVEHLTRMVFHFNMLRERNILPNVPVRDQHRSLFGGGGTVVGYIDGLRVEGEDEAGNALLVADLDITEPDAFAKVQRGTWRSRSAEVGYYETNDEAMYWPVLMGLAWVDLPAVEGLFSKDQKQPEGSYTPIHDDEEGAVAHAKKHSQGEGAPPDPSAGNPEGQGQGAPSPGSTSSEPGDEAGEGDDDGEEQQEGAGEQGNAGAGEGDHGAPPAAPAGSPVTQHAAGTQTATFTINGQPTTDFAAVQRHIENLETVLNENREQARKDFVSSLAESNRIPATQVDAMTAHALSLNDEQYEAFATMYADAPQSPLFSHHGHTPSTEPADEAASEVEVLRERVKMHKRSGIAEEKVRETQSYKRLMELTDNKG